MSKLKSKKGLKEKINKTFSELFFQKKKTLYHFKYLNDVPTSEFECLNSQFQNKKQRESETKSNGLNNFEIFLM